MISHLATNLLPTVHVMTQIPDIPILVTNPAYSLAWFSVQNDLLLVVSLRGTLGRGYTEAVECTHSLWIRS